MIMTLSVIFLYDCIFSAKSPCRRRCVEFRGEYSQKVYDQEVFDENIYCKMAGIDTSQIDRFEVDVSTVFEACTLQQRSTCTKNPHHPEFVPINDFNLSHLPKGYQDEDILKIVKGLGDLTVRVTVPTVSQSRPEFFPNSTKRYPYYTLRGIDGIIRNGTGRIVFAKMYTEQDDKPCPCPECQSSDKVTKGWGEIWVITARHVVFDDFEARHTTCGLFFDLPGGPRKVVKGGWVDEDLSGPVVKGDWSIFKCASCDLDLVDLLQDMINDCHGLCEQVSKKYEKTRDVDKLAVIVSHPHGCSAHVTVGQWIDRRVTLNEVQPENSDVVCLGTSYTYTNCTCPGSSGAYVYKLGHGGWAPIHTHFGVDDEGKNFSGEAMETVEAPNI